MKIEYFNSKKELIIKGCDYIHFTCEGIVLYTESSKTVIDAKPDDVVRIF